MDITKNGQIDPQKVIKPITSFTKKIEGLSPQARKKRLSNRKVHDLTALIYVHYTYINSEGIKNARYGEFRELLERTKRLEDAYNNQDSLIAVYKYFKKLIDFVS